jgi:hypothetical protein
VRLKKSVVEYAAAYPLKVSNRWKVAVVLERVREMAMVRSWCSWQLVVGNQQTYKQMTEIKAE